MRVYIAEKPSLARAIADALPKPLQKKEGHIITGNGDIVTWCIGHLLEQAQPEDYDPELRQWRFDRLPIVPNEWKLKPKPSTKKQLNILKHILRNADEIVHAGDPDREGQLLVDEVISYLNITKARREKIQRLLISDLTPASVKRALSQLQSNQNFASLSISALARARADWLYGINLTRAFTLRGQHVGYRGVLSVGRVQTPILGLVVRRDEEIASFQSKPYYNVWAQLQTQEDNYFRAKWKPSDECEKFLDEQGRNLSRALAEHVVKRVSFKNATVQSVVQKQNKQNAPLPHNLSSLQIEANKVFGYSAKKVLDICQRLYETHKLITYPRSDCRYLPEEHFVERTNVLAAVENNLTSLGSMGEFRPGLSYSAISRDLKQNQKSMAWNDKKVGAHHAIVPTAKQSEKQAKPLSLSLEEANLYMLVCRHYLIQFLGQLHTETREVQVDIENGCFVAKSKEVLESGWKLLFPQSNQHDKNTEACEDGADNDNNMPLPKNIKKGDSLKSLQAEVEEKFTTPPKPFTEATLISAMTGISRYVQDAELKRVLKDTDGLGTEATRAHIIELLFHRGFLQRKGKQVLSTEAGRALISALPESTTLPDRTARWESLLQAISERCANYQDLMSPLVEELGILVKESEKVIPIGLKGLVANQTFKKKNTKEKKTFKNTKAGNAKRRA